MPFLPAVGGDVIEVLGEAEGSRLWHGGGAVEDRQTQ